MNIFHTSYFSNNLLLLWGQMIFCKIHLGIFKAVFSGHCRSLSRFDMQLCPPACPSPISVSVPTVVPTSECLAVTGVPQAECVLCAALPLPASLWALMH